MKSGFRNNKTPSSSSDTDSKRKKAMDTSEWRQTVNTTNRKRYRDQMIDFSWQNESQLERLKPEASVSRVPLTKDFHNEIDHGMFGSVTKDMQHLIALRHQIYEGKRFERTEHGSSIHRSVQQNLKENCTSALLQKDPFTPHLLEQVNYDRLGSDLEGVMGLISLIKAKRQRSAVVSPLECKALDFDQSFTEDPVEANQSKTQEVTISNGYNDENDYDSAILEERVLETQNYLTGQVIILDSSDEDPVEANQSKTQEVTISNGYNDDENDYDNAILEERVLETQNYLTGQVIILDSSDDEATEPQAIHNCSFQEDKNFPQNQSLGGECAVVSGESEFAINEDVNVINDKISGNAEQSANEYKIKEDENAHVGEDKTPPLGAEFPKGVYVNNNGSSYDEEYQTANEVKIWKEKTGYFSEGKNETKCMHTDVEDETGLEKCNDEQTYTEIENEQGPGQTCDEDSDAESETKIGYNQADVNDNEMADIWMEMGVAIECSKDTVKLPSNSLQNKDCDHVLILKDDIGYVCRICGLIQQAIEKIIEYQFRKDTRTRTYWNEDRSSSAEINGKILDKFRPSTHDFSDIGIYPHPRHGKLMKPHQVEGFKFLISNLMTEAPGGCILAHAPGSGKTFMLISFLQSFMAQEPSARPLVVLPKGLISIWKREFEKWKVESFPLYDLYSANAESRSQQLEVIQQWVKTRSILFLGYTQFSSIVCDFNCDVVSTECTEILLTCPSILILDEGHTPRNNDTDLLMSLQKVQTPRKVVLSGTLFQNHVEEVFNVLNLVRPKFLKIDKSKEVKRRILSRVDSLKNKNLLKNCSEKEFYDVVENTILKDQNFKRKVAVIQDLRDMTSGVLHYYKGDYLDELPGLVDFTVHLKLSKRQEREVVELEKLGNRFKIISEGSVLYVHPQLKNRLRDSGGDNCEKIDQILETLDVNDGVKAKFFLNLLQLCESTGEKLLVFSQYILPLKFLERLVIRMKNYSVGKETFMITGDSDSHLRELSTDRFNNSADARVFFGSIKACGEGISLVGASRIIILDVHLNPSVSRQAVGRAFRPGQTKKVYVYRLIAHDSLEVENHKTCFKKESIAKLWFEWAEHYGDRSYELESIDLENCGDLFLESPKLSEDVHSVFRR